MSVRLQFPSGICVGGETLRGEVELLFPGAEKEKIKEVVVRLRGSIFVKINRSNSHSGTRTCRESIDIISQDRLLWKRDRNIPKGQQDLRLPFNFELPPNSPPSCRFTGRTIRRSQRYEAAVVYFIEVAAVKSGFFKKTRYVRRPLAVLPMDKRGAPISQEIQRLGISFPTQIREFQKKIHRGLFGRSASVRMQITFPNIDLFPLFTRIPYVLHIVTTTKRMKFDQKSEDPGVKLFPSPPTKSVAIQFALRQHVSLQAKGEKGQHIEDVARLGGLGKSASKQHVDVQVMPKIWRPLESKEDKGSWTQETAIRSFIVLRWTPTFNCPIMSVSYVMHIRVRFPGLGNDMNVAIPIHVTSGLSSSAQSNASFTHGDHDLDLPPPYWNACEEWSDEDEEALAQSSSGA